MRHHSSRKGLTLIELLIFIGIFSGAAVVFVTILVLVTRIQVRQTAAAEVQQQSQLLLQTIQRYAERASLINMPTDVSTSTLSLYVASTSAKIYLDSTTGLVHLEERYDPAGGGGMTTSALTTDNVYVTDLTFKRFANPPGHDAVSVIFTMKLNSTKPDQQYSNTLATGIARVGAVTFDSDVVPQSANSYSLGAAGSGWYSINGFLYFDNTNQRIGIKTAFPQEALEVDGNIRANGGVMLNPTGSRGGCGLSNRGMFWVNFQGGNASDTISVCLGVGSGVFSWVDLATQ